MKQQKVLRSGYTTGTCAAAAAKAAAGMLFSNTAVSKVSVALPGGGRAELFVEEAACFEDKLKGNTVLRAVCAVRKDAGDDPDVTNGTLVYASVSRVRGAFGKFEKPCYFDADFPLLFLTGGEGIGMVTKKGLPCEPGGYAINPVPQRMIMRETTNACLFELLEKDEQILVEISVPDGVRLADKTFNSRLGIEGGISILGTSGIVNPMSEQALIETIRLEIRVQVQAGKKLLAVAPGNYGEQFLRKDLGISMDSFIKCSNFIGETFHMLEEEGVEEVLLAGHIGKLVKVAGGVLNTHSAFGDRRMEILSQCAADTGMPAECREALLLMNTTEEAVEYLKHTDCLEPVISLLLDRIKAVLKACSNVSAEILVFSSVYGILGMTDGARETIRKLT